MRVRRTQEERREQTQERILTAAIEVMNRRGYAGFRVSEVASVAGVSRGAQLHHFKTKDELIAAALTRVFTIAHKEAEERLAKLPPSADRSLSVLFDAMIEDAIAFFFGDNFRFALDMSLAGSRDLQVAAVARDIIQREARPNEQVWIELFERAGLDAERAIDVVWLVRSVVRGLMVRSLNSPEAEIKDRVIGLLRAMMGDYFDAAAVSSLNLSRPKKKDQLRFKRDPQYSGVG